MEFRNELLIVVLIVLLIWFLMRQSRENFDATTTEFVPIGKERYGLRGDLLRRSDISRIYINPNRHIRLNPSSGWMYASNSTPCEEGISGCHKTKCPCKTDEYDELDTCWMCDKMEADPMKIPPIHPHVPN